MNALATNRSLRLGVLVSGGGTTLENLLAVIVRRELDAEVRVVVSSNPRARGLEIARRAGVPAFTVERRGYPTLEAFSRATFDHCRAHDVDLVAMGGYLKLVQIPADFELRVMNVHPSLIPAFCGKNFYGHHVHEAVLAAGAKVSGCTVHFVDNQYDHGPIIVQRAVPVEETDTPQSLAARVFAAECHAFPEAIALFSQGRLQVEGQRVRVLPAAEP